MCYLVVAWSELGLGMRIAKGMSIGILCITRCIGNGRTMEGRRWKADDSYSSVGLVYCSTANGVAWP